MVQLMPEPCFLFLPQQAARRFNIIFQLEDGAAADGHTAVILNLYRVLHIVRLGHRAAIFNLQQQEEQQGHFLCDGFKM